MCLKKGRYVKLLTSSTINKSDMEDHFILGVSYQTIRTLTRQCNYNKVKGNTHYMARDVLSAYPKLFFLNKKKLLRVYWTNNNNRSKTITMHKAVKTQAQKIIYVSKTWKCISPQRLLSQGSCINIHLLRGISLTRLKWVFIIIC